MKRKEMKTLSTNAKHEWDFSTCFVFMSPALRVLFVLSPLNQRESAWRA
jgi:hypothetical protein